MPGCRPGPNLTSILLRFCLLPMGSRSDTDLAPQCPGLGPQPSSSASWPTEVRFSSAHWLSDLLTLFGP